MATDDIVTRLRVTTVADAAEHIYQTMADAADEIERLRTMLAHGLTDAYDCEGCSICKELKAFHEQVIDKSISKNPNYTQFIHPEGRDNGL